MQKIKLGLIPSPDLPAELTNKFIDDLPTFLHDAVDDTVLWEPEIVVAPLVGSAEYMNQLMNKAIHLKKMNDWDYVICLTDLPHFMDKYVVVADINKLQQVALISIPAFGAFPVKQRTKRTIATVLNDIHRVHPLNPSHTSRKAYKKTKKKPFLSGISRHDRNLDLENETYDEKAVHLTDNTTENKQEFTAHQDESIEQDQETEEYTKDNFTQEDTVNQSNVRYRIKSKWLGYLRILAGMTFANRPWSALFYFRKIIMLAFGTGIYITLFPTPWELSTIYSIPRFILLMLVAIFGMVTWIIFAHQLWEKPTHKGDIRLRKLYNYTTISTLSGIVVINYIVLFCFFLAAIGIFVPPSLFEAVTDIDGEASLKYYFQLTWLITSLGTLAGSIGTMSEDEGKIRQITYSYRQINRYYDIQDEDKDDKEQGI